MWGNTDFIASPGTVDVSGLTVTGTGTFFANNYSAGDVIDFGSTGSAVILNIANNTSLTLTSNVEITTSTLANVAFTVSEKPVEVIEGDATMLANTVYGVSVEEMASANAQSVVSGIAHAGWVYVSNAYTDTHGNTRRKTEVLVASSSIGGDADDDSILPE